MWKVQMDLQVECETEKGLEKEVNEVAVHFGCKLQKQQWGSWKDAGSEGGARQPGLGKPETRVALGI